MNLEELKEGITVYDADAPQFGEGLLITYDDDMVDVYYPDIEETVNYSQKDAVKYLTIVEK